MKSILTVILVNIILFLLGLEIVFAALLFFNNSNKGLLVPEYLYSSIISRGENSLSGKAKLVFDENNSPIYVNGVKSYFSSRTYSKNGLLVSDEELLNTRPEKLKIIGVFGDSYTEGLQVDQSKTFVSLLNQHLKKNNINIHLINFAVGSTGTIDQLNRIRSTVDKYKLNGILLFFLPQNDVLNNSAHPQNGSISNAKSIGCKKISSEIVKVLLKNSFAGRGLCYHYRVILGKYSSTSAEDITSTEVNESKGRAFFESDRNHWFDVYSKPRDVIWEDAWKNTFLSLKKIKQIAKERKIPFSVVSVADSLQIFYNFNTHQFKRNLEFKYPNTTLMNFCKINEIICYDSLDYIINYINNNNIKEPYMSFKNDGHYSEVGHGVMRDFLLQTDLFNKNIK